MKKIAILLTALLLVCTLTSCSLSGPKTYTVQEMNITLDGLFYQQNDIDEEMEGLFLSFSSIIMVNRIAFSELGIDGEMTAEDMTSLLSELMGDNAELREEDGITYFITTADVEGTAMESFYTMFTSEEACWLVAMIPVNGTVEENLPTYVEWSRSICFTEAE